MSPYPMRWTHAGPLLDGARPDAADVVAATVALLQRLAGEH